MKVLVAGTAVVLALAVAYALRAKTAPVVADAMVSKVSTVERYAEVELGGDDPLSAPLDDGIVWYGTWEDAMAEKERTGKPVMLHFGSPRCPADGVHVPGTW